MTLQWILAWLHLLALGIGLGAVWARGLALADNFWGAAAALWIVTGLLRAFGGFGKGAPYYLHNTAFLLKMALFIAVLLHEIRPMVTLIRWRARVSRGELPTDLAVARRLARISYVEAILVVLMVLAATAMARGIGS
jgi:putative membrane protein